jgi:hypothetical protein
MRIVVEAVAAVEIVDRGRDASAVIPGELRSTGAVVVASAGTVGTAS